MKTYKKYIIALIILAISVSYLTSCSDLLDMEPLDRVTSEAYFNHADQLGDYAIKYYNFPTLSGMTSIVDRDNGTDIQVSSNIVSKWIPGEWRVPSSKSGWTFDRIRAFNYFFSMVLPKYEKGEISGSESDIKHYIGEIYFLRAYEYFNKLKTFGDFPIITDVLENDKDVLIAANKRMPMNKVGRFILSDLDKAINYMSQSSIDGGRRNRLTKDAAYIFKSRVALYLGTWFKYFKGTAFVPGTPNWPGKDKYSENIEIYDTNIDDEIRFFLKESINAAEKVAETHTLTQNTFDDPTKLQQSPYVRMFADYDLSSYDEVIFWREYSLSKGVSHRINNFVQWPVNGGYMGFSRGYVESFLMDNGLPIYAEKSGYKGDMDFESIRANRDDRLKQFLKVPGDELCEGLVADKPVLYGHEYTTTGYITKKFKSNRTGAAQTGEETGFPIFRVAEAYLNYMEADYELNGTVSKQSEKYWAELRERAGIDPNYKVTDNATDMSIEAQKSFSAYSAGSIIDVTLYNIRRERACEFISEGFRMDDLRRWRSMDQLINNPHHPEGLRIWGSETFSSWYKESLHYLGDDSGKTPNMSSPDLSEYIRPYQKIKSNLLFNGMTWTSAHYLSPIDMGQFNITSQMNDGEIDYETSPLYQNPGWPIIANKGPELN